MADNVTSTQENVTKGNALFDPFATVGAKLTANGFKFTLDPGANLLLGGFRYLSSLGPVRFTHFSLSSIDGYMVNYTRSDLRLAVPYEKAATVISRINNSLLCGNFQIDDLSLEVVYKNTISLTAVQHCDYPELYRFISLPTAMFRKYDNALRLLAEK